MSGIAPVILATRRTRLRLAEPADAQQLFALYADREVMRYWNHAAWTLIDQAVDAINEARWEYTEGTSMHYVIEHVADGTVIGSCALYAMVDGGRRASLGYLLSRAYWRQGYFQEAIPRFLDHAFTVLGIDTIDADVHPANIASAHALSRLGFRPAGCRRGHWIVDGKRCDVHAYRLQRHSWTGGLPGDYPVELIQAHL